MQLGGLVAWLGRSVPASEEGSTALLNTAYLTQEVETFALSRWTTARSLRGHDEGSSRRGAPPLLWTADQQ